MYHHPLTLTVYKELISVNIYKKETKPHRKIYEEIHGPIPKDSTGRTYEIHHIDGNHSNNDPKNLIAVTIQEHYNIHYSQGDWAACLLMSERMNISPEEKSRLASINGKIHNSKRVAAGTHPWQGGKVSRRVAKERLENGTHNLLGESNPSHNRVREGTHNFQNKEWSRERTKKQIANGKNAFVGLDNPAFIKYTCPYCGKTGGKNGMMRWHGINCKSYFLS